MSYTNRKEKEEKVIELYKQGKTVREIVKIAHMSFGTISSIIKKFTDEETHKIMPRVPVSQKKPKPCNFFFKAKHQLK